MRTKKPKAPKIPAYPCRDVYSKIMQARFGEECWAEWPFHPTRKFRFDYAWPQWKVAVEIDGGLWTYGRHSGGVGQKKDLEKMNAAAEMGWLVLHYTPDERLDSKTLLQIYRTIQLRKNERTDGLAGISLGVKKGEGEQEGGT